MKYITIVLSAIILVLGVYCKSLKSDLEISEQNNEILKNSIKVQDETISKLKDDYSKIQSANSELNELYKSQMKRFQIQGAINSFEISILKTSKECSIKSSESPVELSSKERSSVEPKKVQYSIYECYKDPKCEILR